VYPYVLGDPKIDTKVLSKYPGRMINSGDRISDPNDQARYSFYKINIQGHVLTLVNLHLLSFMLTPKEREVFTGIRSLEDFKTSYREIKGDIADKLKKGFVRRKKDTQILRNAIEDIEGPLILCGDFNDVPESYAYRTLKGDDLRDAYVETNFGPLITYNRHKMLFHIDQILYRGPLQALSVDKGRIRTSDHYPLMARFAFTDSE
ncbi:MAG: endonuclease/exonuclease/phosphatase family protein, partial [Muribaculaceae bacterium]|nr:endonuclease/exonuclease/phosphatase family protein [Muribaculaceae bacterium]